MKLAILLLFCCGLINAQNSIVGSITTENGEPLPYASVFLLSSKVGAASNENGNYIISSIPNHVVIDTLVVSYVGYLTKKKPFRIGDSNSINISLTPKLISISEITINATTQKKANEIIKLAIKNIKNNYCQSRVKMNGHYVEQIKEDNKWVEINESIISLLYEPYPQKNIIGKGFRTYWKDGGTKSYISQLGSVFMHSQFFPYYVSHKDRVQILSNGISQNNSKFGIEPSPFGGPIDLVAIDKVKYLYDFFDPKLKDRYGYVLKGEKSINGINCYVIDFMPNTSYLDKKIKHSWNKKFDSAIYTGRIYVSKDDFSIPRFEFQFSADPNMSIYDNEAYMPDYIFITVDYKKVNKKWILSNVNVNQTKFVKRNKKNIQYKCKRILSLSLPFKWEDNFFPEDEMPLTFSNSLRFFGKKYAPKLFKQYSDSSFYIPIDENVLIDIENNISLDKQYKIHDYPIDSIDSPIPLNMYNCETEDFNLFRYGNKDSIDMYLQSENLYYKKIAHKFNKDVRRFYRQYMNIYQPDTSKQYVYFDNNKYLWTRNKNNQIVLSKLINDSIGSSVFNYSMAKEGKNNFHLEKISLNSFNKLAYTYSTKGEITNTLIIDSKTGISNTDTIFDVKDFLWYNDSTILYIKTDDAKRSYKLVSHQVGKSHKTDIVLFQENNVNFDLSIKETNSKDFIVLSVESLDENEIYVLKRSQIIPELQLVFQRTRNCKYSIDHYTDNYFYAVSNGIKDNCEFFKINTDNTNIKESIYNSCNMIENFLVTRDYYVMIVYDNLQLSLRYIHKQSKKLESYSFEEEYFTIDFARNSQGSLSKNIVAIEYESPVSAYSVFELNLDTNIKKVIEGDLLYDKFEPNNYETKVLMIPSQDNIKIPLTLFFNKEKCIENIKGVLLKGYGAYGAKQYHEFDAEKIIYANAGYVVAYAHIRGGGELGYNWYQDGKGMNKKNSFHDYISCAKYLKNRYNLESDQLIGQGSSAGGLIMGYVSNNFPNLFGALIFDRPFLDVVETMLDNDLPLTSMEFKEWGNPNEEKVYSYMNTYSAFQNIKSQNFPNMLFFSKYNDQQAPFWQIAKCVAKYRCAANNSPLILMNTEFGVGHRGSINWQKRIDEMAFKYAFILFNNYSNHSVIGY